MTIGGRPIGEMTEKTLRKMAGQGARIHEMSKATGLRIFEVEELLPKLGIEREMADAFEHRKIGWEIVLRGASGQMWVSFAPSTGILTPSNAARLALGDAQWYVLLWAERERLIGIRPAAETDQGARKMRRQFSAKHLVERAGLVKGRYPASMQDGVLVIDVSGAGS